MLTTVKGLGACEKCGGNLKACGAWGLTSKQAQALDDSDSNEGTDSEVRHSDRPLGMVS
jgi:hypothetical protein